MSDIGKVCEHDKLLRTCEVCELKGHVADLTSKLRLVREEVRAARACRNWRSQMGGPDQSDVRQWWDEARSATDAAHALDDTEDK